MKREKIGEIFVKAKIITPAQLERVLTANRSHPDEKLGQTFVRLKMGTDTDIARALSLQFNIPYIDLHTVVIDPSAVKRIPVNLAMQHHFLPIYLERSNLILAMEVPQDFEAIEAARFASGLNIRPHVAPLSEILAAIKRYYSVEQGGAALLQHATPNEDLDFMLKHVKMGEEQVEDLKDQSELPAIVKIVNTIILQGMSMRASAIHIDLQERDVVIKNRIDGELVESMKTPKTNYAGLVARIKLMGGMDIVKRFIPQKGRAKMKMLQRAVELEISSLPTQYGESIIMQILDTGESIPFVKDLGLPSDEVAKIHKLLWLPHGLILVCGSHGRGETTTLYTLLNELAGQQKKIITLEETIEYQLKGAQQVKINEKAGLTFAQALLSVLQHKPDVIFIGEIRDKETADMALKASLNGRLILSTLHTSDIIGTITRLKELSSGELLASSLSGMITQRQVRKICEQCQEEYFPNSKILARLESVLNEKIGGSFYHGKGCKTCNYTGYREQMGVYHTIMMSPGLRTIILQDAPKSGSTTGIGKIEISLLTRAILEKVKQGLTTIEELERVLFTLEKTERVERVEPAVTVKCEHCQQPVSPDSQTCPSCGQPVKKPAAPKVESRPAPVSTPTPVPAQPAASKEGADGNFAFKGFKILIVDSDKKMMQQLGQFLHDKELNVATTDNGEDAWEKITRDKPHLLITEMNVPKLDGLELVKRLRKEHATAAIPVIILSSKNQTADRIKGFAAGTDDYVPKPFSVYELFFRINAILRRVYK